MFFVDTNIFLYAADRSCNESQTCVNLLNEWRSSPVQWHTSWGVIFEFLRTSTHPKIFPQPLTISQAWLFVESILSSPRMKILVQTEGHQLIMKELVEQYPNLTGNIMHDLRNVALMKDHGIRRIYTRDTDFHRFKFLEIINPLD